MKNKPIFYDSDCLASFLIISEHSILSKIFYKIIISTPVHEELLNTNTPDTIKDNLKSLIDGFLIKIIVD